MSNAARLPMGRGLFQAPGWNRKSYDVIRFKENDCCDGAQPAVFAVV